MKTIFFTATNTDVGKTYSMLKAYKLLKDRGSKVYMLKPLESGINLSDIKAVQKSDCYKLMQASGVKDISKINYKTFSLGASVYTCDKNFDMGAFRVWVESRLDALKKEGYDLVLCEGAGGILSPLTLKYFWSDFAKEFCDKLVLVASDKLGELNNILLNERLLKTLQLPYKIFLNIQDMPTFQILNMPFLQDYFSSKDALYKTPLNLDLEYVVKWICE
ncbi:dethiobiotin synthase [Helicobacter sp. 11S02629-2]|uniref:ATP-dependent dethiobiotin synthetase BioD n=1 Tax=Helicobacter sp. 11S02629-2 TaxID=1476195 RepID=UPI000BA7B26E|nr:dethiobiotin synthase [Helicobacter sp. 11S02629-2]PAF41618.1 hypothetical protein BKH40_08360 [Helicobacter sp. 11S02629-2]